MTTVPPPPPAAGRRHLDRKAIACIETSRTGRKTGRPNARNADGRAAAEDGLVYIAYAEREDDVAFELCDEIEEALGGLSNHEGGRLQSAPLSSHRDRGGSRSDVNRKLPQFLIISPSGWSSES